MFSYVTSFNGDISVNVLLCDINNGDIPKWDVSTVSDMHTMFSYAASFNGGIPKWDVSSLTCTQCSLM